MRQAGWACTGCGEALCVQCAVRRPAGNETLIGCRRCGALARTLYVARGRGAYASLLPPAFVYPFSLNGFWMMAAFGIGLYAIDAVGLHRVANALLVSYLFLVVRVSALGKHDVPDADDFTNVMDLGATLGKALLAFVLSIVPAVAYVFVAEKVNPKGWFGHFDEPLLWVALLLGLLWTPIAMLFAAIQSPIATIVNPLSALQVVRVLRLDYVLLLAAFWGLMLVSQVVDVFGAVFAANLPVPILGGVMAASIGMYVPLVGARALGLLLYARGPDFGYGQADDNLEPALGDELPALEAAAGRPSRESGMEVAQELAASLVAHPIASIRVSAPPAAPPPEALDLPPLAEEPPEAPPPVPEPAPDATPSNDVIRVWAAEDRFDLVAQAYRARRGAVDVLDSEGLARTAQAALVRADFQTAAHAFKRLAHDFPHSEWAPEALLRAAELLQSRLRRGDEAVRLLQRLVKNHPQSPQAGEARRRLGLPDAPLTGGEGAA